MKNITLSVDDTVLEQVRVYAAKRKTTVNRLVREHLDQLARAEQKIGSPRDRLLTLVDESPGRMGPGWTWSREDAYQGRVLSGHQHPTVRRSRKAR